MTKHSRRDFVKAAASAAGAIALRPAMSRAEMLEMLGTRLGPRAEPEGWARVPGILARIKPPRFPKRDFLLTRYGAVADGTTDCTEAIRRAIEACHAAGGGRVVATGGVFLTGAVHLRSRVNLHVARGATLRFSRDPKAYLPPVLTRFEGTELMNYSPFIYAYDAEDVAVTGSGTLDGQAGDAYWWGWKGSRDHGWKPGDPDYRNARDRLLALAETGTPVEKRVFGEGDYLRPNFIQPYRCRNVLIEGVTIINSPMWEINPVLCTNVIVRHVTISSHGPNNDGCDPESCRDVLIDGCIFDTGDDCIAIKSGRNADGRRLNVPSENIIVRDCEMRDGHGGVTVGSEISGGTRYVFVDRCRMDSPRLERALRLKNNAMRGGTLEHIYMRDVVVGEVADAVLQVDFLYEEGANGPFTPIVRDVELRRVTSRKSNYALYLRGLDKGIIEDIRVVDCRFDGVAKPDVVEHVSRLQRLRVTVNRVMVGT
ncbi:MAG: glycoside hydrolase family 28 protein [Gemmatimonadaceae bacterium]